MGLSDLLWSDSKLLPIYFFILYIIIISLPRLEKTTDKIISSILLFLIGSFVLLRIFSASNQWLLTISIPVSYLLLFFLMALILVFWTPRIKKSELNCRYALHWSILVIILILYSIGVF